MLLNFEHLKTFYSALKQKMKNFRGNWNQNDPTADDYIKNRPFYSEGDDVEILSRTTIDGGFAEAELKQSLNVEQNYKIVFDNVEYTSVARLYNEIIVVGNLSIIEGTSGGDNDTGEPFLVGAQDLLAQIAINDAESHTIQIFVSQEVIHKIDKKYLPDDIAATDKDVINRLDALEAIDHDAYIEADKEVIEKFAWGSFNKNGIVKVAGLYQTGTDTMIKSWRKLLTEGVIYVDNGVIYTNNSSNILTGDLVFPNDSNVTSIGDNAFYYCRGLTSITISDSVTSIGSEAFSNCHSLTSIVIGDSVTSIGGRAFNGCDSLTSIEYNAVECEDFDLNSAIFNNAGKNGSGIKVIIGANVKKIPEGLFHSVYEERNPKIISVEFEKGNICESIGGYAFSGCSNLTSIIIPDSVTSIGSYAFQSCTNLISGIILGNMASTSINSRAFQDCSNLMSIIIPNSVTYIGSDAFYGCNNLTIYCEAENQPGEWHFNWNDDERPVIWGYTGENYIYTFDTNGGNEIENIISNLPIILPIPMKSGYYFGGWYDNAELIGQSISDTYYVKANATLYAKWLTENEYLEQIKMGTSFEYAIPVECGIYPVVIDQAGETIYFEFTPHENKSYYIHSLNPVDMYGKLYDSDQKLIRSNNGNGLGGFNITHSLIADTTYYITVNLQSKEETGRFKIAIE